VIDGKLVKIFSYFWSYAVNCLVFVDMCYVYTQISKNYVDSYQPGKWIPHYQLWASFAASDVLCVRCVTLLGAKWPYNTFIIRPPTPHGLGMHMYMFMHAC
jgi:hypothetical protein